jgi:copper chaperone CopZ
MEKLLLTIPTLYGDHHTTAVRSLLGRIPGVADVFVSAASHQVTFAFDSTKATRPTIEKALADAGYEPGTLDAAFPVGFAEKIERQSAAYAGTGSALAFAEQTQVVQGRPLWPCPGFDPRTPHAVD